MIYQLTKLARRGRKQKEKTRTKVKTNINKKQKNTREDQRVYKEKNIMRNKNAKREHYVAAFTGEGSDPAEANFFQLAKYITDITDGSDDKTDEFADYAGDGTVQTDIIGIQESWDISGTFDATDEAQALIAGMKRKVGNERKLWHRIVDSNGAEEIVGVATALSIVAGSGAADEHEEFSCTLQFDQRPTVNPL